MLGKRIVNFEVGEKSVKFHANDGAIFEIGPVDEVACAGIRVSKAKLRRIVGKECENLNVAIDASAVGNVILAIATVVFNHGLDSKCQFDVNIEMSLEQYAANKNPIQVIELEKDNAE